MGSTRYRKEDVGPPLLALSFHAPKRIGLGVGRGPCRNSTFSYTLTYFSGGDGRPQLGAAAEITVTAGTAGGARFEITGVGVAGD